MAMICYVCNKGRLVGNKVSHSNIKTKRVQRPNLQSVHALVDGANRAQALAYIVMPLALPGIIATAIFTFIVAWNDFLFALVLIGKDDLKTLAIGINDFFHMAVVDWGLIMAAGVMVTIPALVFFVAVQRYLIAGWGAGGVKG